MDHHIPGKSVSEHARLARRAEAIEGRSMRDSPLVATMLALAFVVTLDVAAYIYWGAPIAAATVVASLAALLGWASTAARRPARRASDGRAAFTHCVATVVALLVLYADQWASEFPARLTRLFPGASPSGVGLSGHVFVAAFPLAGSGILILGALAYHQGIAFGRFAAWFTFAWGAVAALAVYVYPLFGNASAWPFPGAFTAPLPLATSLLGAWTLARREERSSLTAATASRHPPSDADHADRSARR